MSEITRVGVDLAKHIILNSSVDPAAPTRADPFDTQIRVAKSRAQSLYASAKDGGAAA